MKPTKLFSILFSLVTVLGLLAGCATPKPPAANAPTQAPAVEGLGVSLACEGLLDTKPIPVIGYRSSKQRSDFLGSAAYGYCASKKMHNFGYNLVTISSSGGIPLIYDLLPANTDERQAAATLLHQLSGFHLFADKGFLGQAWQAVYPALDGNCVWTPKRKNQVAQPPHAFEQWLNGLRIRIEGLFNEIQNVGRNVERLLAKTICGLCARIAANWLVICGSSSYLTFASGGYIIRINPIAIGMFVVPD